MRLAICLFKFFRYGGLARDFLKIANVCISRGHSVTVFAMEWHGDIPHNFNVKILSARHLQNHLRTKIYIKKLETQLNQNTFDLVIGFNKMPKLDIYYAADPCYKEKTLGFARFFYRLGGRYRYYSYCEETVFSTNVNTVSLMLASSQIALFKKHYHTPDERLLLLPPGISKDKIAPKNATQIRADFRMAHAIATDEKMLLMIGSCFKTKGLDRTLKALALLPTKTQHKIKLFVVGEGNDTAFQKWIKRLNTPENVVFFGGQDDVSRFLLGADLLLQPSYRENTGTAIIEAIASELPVLVSDVCGYASHVRLSAAGKVLPSPFNSQQFADTITQMLVSPERTQWMRNARHYARTTDLYSMPEVAVDYIEQIAAQKNNR